MTSPYRSEIDALRERQGSLEQELARLRQHTTELEGLRARQHELERELAGISQRIGAGARRALPMLDQVRVASPCPANWNEMLGDDRVRFCVGCEKNVYNLSAMPQEEAERLLEERARGELCVRFYQRADGTIMTADCPVGVKKKRRKKLALAVAGAGAMALAASSLFLREECRTVQGAMAVPVETLGEAEIAPPVVAVPPADEPSTPSVMGSIAPPPPAPPAPSPAIMGRRSSPVRR